MSVPQQLIKIRQRLASTPRRRVLVVEGGTDVDFLSWMLDKPPYQDINIEAHLLIAPAGGKEQVLSILQNEPGWLGMVDRDAWDDAACEAAAKAHPGLRILPRFTLESFAIQPDEVWAALTGAQRRGMPGGEKGFCARIEEGLPHAVAHGALWRVAQPLYDGLRSLGFNDALLDYDREINVQNVYDILSAWHQYLAPAPLAEQFEAELHKARGLPKERLWRVWVHGKHFWRRRMYPALAPVADARPDAMLRELFRRMPVPRDLQPLLNELCGGCS